MPEHHIFLGFFLAWLLGALIGLEREMPRHDIREDSNIRFGGLRSYSLIGTFGALMAYFDSIALGTQYWVFVGAIFCLVFIGLSYTYSAFRLNRMGITSEYAGMFVYFNGVLAMSGLYTISISLAILLLLILSSKDYLIRVRKHIDREELMNTVKFAIIALVILPLLPNTSFSFADIAHAIGVESATTWTMPVLTMHFFNPYSLWKFVVVMSAVDFIGYILSKIIGSRGGIITSGLIGGLVSSTAVTASMTEKSKKDTQNTDSYVTSTLVANLIMFIRVLVIASFFAGTELLSVLIIPEGVMILTLIGFILYHFFQKTEKNQKVMVEEKSYESPFQILPAIKFSLIILVVKFLSAFGMTYESLLGGFHDLFYYILGMISGFTDVDAITMDMSQKAFSGTLSLLLASGTIITAMISNNFVKGMIAWRFGEKRFGTQVFVALELSTLAGLLVIILLSVFQ